MSIRSPRVDPEGVHPSPYRGCKWVVSDFPGQRTALVHGSQGEKLGEFRVPERLATERFEAMLEKWLEEEADPRPAAEPARHLKLTA